jgi:hypothetical protein
MSYASIPFRVESAHSVLKDWLDTSVGGFPYVVSKIDAMIEDQIHHVRSYLEKDRNTSPTTLIREKDPLKTVFSKLLRKVSISCLKLLTDHVARINDPNRGYDSSNCNDAFWTTCRGLPCPHYVEWAIKNVTPIPLEAIHPFWRALSSEGVEEAALPKDEPVPQDEQDLLYQELLGEMDNGSLSEDVLHQILTVYGDRTRPGGTKMKEPHHIAPKGRPRKDSHVEPRDKTWLEHM